MVTWWEKVGFYNNCVWRLLTWGRGQSQPPPSSHPHPLLLLTPDPPDSDSDPQMSTLSSSSFLTSPPRHILHNLTLSQPFFHLLFCSHFSFRFSLSLHLLVARLRISAKLKIKNSHEHPSHFYSPGISDYSPSHPLTSTNSPSHSLTSTNSPSHPLTSTYSPSHSLASTYSPLTHSLTSTNLLSRVFFPFHFHSLIFHLLICVCVSAKWKIELFHYQYPLHHLSLSLSHQCLSDVEDSLSLFAPPYHIILSGIANKLSSHCQ